MILEAAAPAEASAQHCSSAAPEMERAALPSSRIAVHAQVLAGWDKELETCWPLEFQTSCIMISVQGWITVSATLGLGYSNSLWNIKKCSCPPKWAFYCLNEGGWSRPRYWICSLGRGGREGGGALWEMCLCVGSVLQEMNLAGPTFIPVLRQ